MKKMTSTKNSTTKKHPICKLGAPSNMVELCNYVYDIIINHGSILFVGNNIFANKIIENEAIRCDEPYIIGAWPRRYTEHCKPARINKESLVVRRLVFPGFKSRPSCLIVVEPHSSLIAIRDARLLRIPIVAISNGDINIYRHYQFSCSINSFNELSNVLSAIADAIVKAKNSASYSLGRGSRGAAYRRLGVCLRPRARDWRGPRGTEYPSPPQIPSPDDDDVSVDNKKEE